MPNRKAHVKAGIAAGSIGAAIVAGNKESNVLLEGVGGGLGGWIGALLPDIIDPPTSPRHRSLGHGVAPIAAAMRVMVVKVPEWQAELRRLAENEKQATVSAPNEWARLGHMLGRVLLLVAAGALVGLVCGYASHILMDATTAGGLPFVA